MARLKTSPERFSNPEKLRIHILLKIRAKQEQTRSCGGFLSIEEFRNADWQSAVSRIGNPRRDIFERMKIFEPR
jgi:hypothetical protein